MWVHSCCFPLPLVLLMQAAEPARHARNTVLSHRQRHYDSSLNPPPLRVKSELVLAGSFARGHLCLGSDCSKKFRAREASFCAELPYFRHDSCAPRRQNCFVTWILRKRYGDVLVYGDCSIVSDLKQQISYYWRASRHSLERQQWCLLVDRVRISFTVLSAIFSDMQAAPGSKSSKCATICSLVDYILFDMCQGR